jgi:hypothetical protein
MYMYFYTTQHCYCNLNIRSYLRLKNIKPYYIFKLYFDELFSRDTNTDIRYETQKLGPHYTEELDRSFTRDEVRERIFFN